MTWPLAAVEIGKYAAIAASVWAVAWAARGFFKEFMGYEDDKDKKER